MGETCKVMPCAVFDHNAFVIDAMARSSCLTALVGRADILAPVAKRAYLIGCKLGPGFASPIGLLDNPLYGLRPCFDAPRRR
jgi:hypothetical protein